MHSFTPRRRMYSAVPPSLLSSDDTHGDDPKLVFGSRAQSSKLNPRTIHRHSFLFRVIIFVSLEFGFITLVSAALWKPIILHLSFTITEIKSAITLTSILWHTLAIYTVKDILLRIFSAEWIRQDEGSQSLTLQELDIVSRLTTGFVDQAKHFVSKRATTSFRLGFLSLLLLILLNGLGPSAISINLVPYKYPCDIQVANLTIGGNKSDVSASAIHRASLITQLERVENFTTSGYSTAQQNILIPWPRLDAMSPNMSMTYESDVIRYNFTCSWKKPSMDDGRRVNAAFLTVPGDQDGDGWTLYSQLSFDNRVAPDALRDSVIFPLQRAKGLSESSFETSTKITANSSLISFIFIGRNASDPTILNLKDIPSFLLQCGTAMNPSLDRDCLPLLASVLVCNPQLDVLPASINATMSSLEATILPGITTVKNIPTKAANIILSSSLFGTTSERPAVGVFNAVSSRLFLPDRVFDLVDSDQPIKPLPLQTINQNMNDMLASSAKAYLSGYTLNDSDNMRLDFSMVNTSAMMEVQKMALVGSKPFLVASSVVVGLLVILLGVLVVITKADQLEGFELENIVKRMQLQLG